MSWSGSHSRSYLLVLMAVTTVAFALPIFFAPLRWAGGFRWRPPREADGRDLAVYFGRCLGACVLILEALMLRAALTGEGLEFTFQILLAVATMMVVVHVWGALARIQPMTETWEILMYAGLGLLTLLFFPLRP